MSTNAKRKEIYNLTKISLCVALLCVSSYLVFPLPFTPIVISLHTIVVNLIGLVLRPRQAAFLTMSAPFLLGDVVKCVMASFVGVALNRALPQNP